MSNKSLNIGTILQGKTYSYCIEKILGQGSFGITYMASIILQGELGVLNVNTRVAIKEFFMRDINGRNDSVVTSGSKGGLYDKYKQKFAKEAINLSKLNHPNIIKVLESFSANNTEYYVMEYIDGSSLHDYTESHNGLSESESITLISTIANAVSYMHNNKMLHLDIKPSNIMLRKDGTPILIDFGLSKQFDENGIPESSTSIGGGTPGYAPIEQFNYHGGTTLPVTMDVYALGATFFKLLTNTAPAEASILLNEGFPIKILQNKGVSNHTISIIEKSMSAIVNARYTTVKDFIDALHHNEEETIIDPQPQQYTNNESDTIYENDEVEPIITPHQQKERNSSNGESIKWIDIQQFLDSTPYKTRFLSTIILSLVGLFFFILYLLNFEDTYAVIALLLSLIVFISVIVNVTAHSGIITKIYNIEDIDNKYRRIQNRHGKLGLCLCGKRKMKRLLAMRFNSIEHCGENIYICRRSGKEGLYNADIRKMVIPLSKHTINTVKQGVINVNENGNVSQYTTKGFRIINH